MTTHDNIIRELQGCMHNKPSDGLKNRIINNAAIKTTEKYAFKRRVGMRGAMAAAIIIVVTMLFGGVALAAVSLITGNTFWGVLFVDRDGSGIEGVTSVANSHPFSEAFREFVNTEEWESVDENEPSLMLLLANSNNPTFSTLDEVADFFGIQIPRNTILDRHAFDTFFEDFNIRSSIMYHPEYDEASVLLNFFYLLSPEDILDLEDESRFLSKTNAMVGIRFIVRDETGGANDFRFGYGGESDIIEHYTSPRNGIEAVLHYWEGTYVAVFSVNNLIYDILLTDRHEADSSVYFDTLKAIIDAFE
jgi:hypothetical protein